jgi:hypothetical protein
MCPRDHVRLARVLLLCPKAGLASSALKTVLLAEKNTGDDGEAVARASQEARVGDLGSHVVRGVEVLHRVQFPAGTIGIAAVYVSLREFAVAGSHTGGGGAAHTAPTRRRAIASWISRRTPRLQGAASSEMPPRVLSRNASQTPICNWRSRAGSSVAERRRCFSGRSDTGRSGVRNAASGGAVLGHHADPEFVCLLNFAPRI